MPGIPQLVVLVDGADRVVGFARATYVHALGILHRTVAVVVLDAAGRVVVRSSRGRGRAGAIEERWEPVRWRHVLPGETPEVAATRCLARAHGASPSLRQVLSLVYDVPRGRREREHEFVHVYAASAPGSQTGSTHEKTIALDTLLAEVAVNPTRCPLRAQLVLHALAGDAPQLMPHVTQRVSPAPARLASTVH